MSQIVHDFKCKVKELKLFSLRLKEQLKIFLYSAVLGKLIWWLLFAAKLGEELKGKQVSYWAIAMVRYDGRENPKKDDIGKTWQNLITEGY